jgi:hypothetical protein
MNVDPEGRNVSTKSTLLLPLHYQGPSSPKESNHTASGNELHNWNILWRV